MSVCPESHASPYGLSSEKVGKEVGRGRTVTGIAPAVWRQDAAARWSGLLRYVGHCTTIPIPRGRRGVGWSDLMTPYANRVKSWKRGVALHGASHAYPSCSHQLACDEPPRGLPLHAPSPFLTVSHRSLQFLNVPLSFPTFSLPPPPKKDKGWRGEYTPTIEALRGRDRERAIVSLTEPASGHTLRAVGIREYHASYHP
jgi:hypothetical protein